MIKFLAENNRYKVYSIEESIYLKDKDNSSNHNDYKEADFFIAWHYENPNDAIILNTKELIIVSSGCGISIYNHKTKEEKSFFSEPKNIDWTNGLHQDEIDKREEFCFIKLAKDSHLVEVVKMNAKTFEFEKISK